MVTEQAESPAGQFLVILIDNSHVITGLLFTSRALLRHGGRWDSGTSSV